MVQTGHKDLVASDGESPKYFFIATDEVSVHLYVTLDSNLHVYYSSARKKLLRETFVMEWMEIPLGSVFTGRGCVQHACRQWCGENFICYHS